MTDYNTSELSVEDGWPIELYTVTRDSSVYRYTSADYDVTFGGLVYSAYPMTRDAISQAIGASRATIVWQMSISVPFVQIYLSTPPTSTAQVQIQRFHTGSTDIQNIYNGRITSVEFVSSTTAKVTLEPVFTSLRRPVVTRQFQTLCPLVLYGAGLGQCNADQPSKAVAAVLSGATGTVLTAGVFGTFPDHYFDGGLVTFNDGTATQARSISSQIGANITIALPFTGVVGGSSVVAYPGCDRTTGSNGCTKFANIVNFGGQPNQPPKSPMAKIPIY